MFPHVPTKVASSKVLNEKSCEEMVIVEAVSHSEDEGDIAAVVSSHIAPTTLLSDNRLEDRPHEEILVDKSSRNGNIEECSQHNILEDKIEFQEDIVVCRAACGSEVSFSKSILSTVHDASLGQFPVTAGQPEVSLVVGLHGSDSGVEVLEVGKVDGDMTIAGPKAGNVCTNLCDSLTEWSGLESKKAGFDAAVSVSCANMGSRFYVLAEDGREDTAVEVSKAITRTHEV